MADVNPVGMGVLNEEHLNQLLDAEKKLAEAKRQLDLAERAGIDTGTTRDLVTKYESQIRQIKQTYFPGS